MSTTYTVNIPFEGFYESIHNANIEDAIDQISGDDSGEIIPNFAGKLYTTCRFAEVHQHYAKWYVAAFAEACELPSMKFKLLSSPREYNFETNTIDVTIDADDLKTLVRGTGSTDLTTVCSERHTSCSGFVSFYDPNWNSWGSVGTWDENQLGSLLRAYIRTQEIDLEGLVEDINCNGDLTSWIETATPGIEAMYKEYRDYD